VGAKGADPDHRVGRVGVDVGDRGVVQVDAQRPHSGPSGLVLRPDEGGVAGGPGGHLAGEDRGHPGQPGHDPALLIGADQQREVGWLAAGGLLQPGRERRDLGRVADVRPEVDDPADVIAADQAGPAVRGGAPGHRRHQQLADLVRQRHPVHDRGDPG
jgi:hypothetical protein